MVTSNLIDNLKCGICFEIFDDVVETPCCGHGYCRKCLTQSLGSAGGRCPSCREMIAHQELRKNMMVQRMVDELPIDCPNRECQMKITRGILEEHRNVCPFQLIDCPNSPQCGQLERRMLAFHLVECSHKEIQECSIHGRPRTLFCEFDGEIVCPACSLIGSHRHHRCFPWNSVRQATFNVTCSAISSSLSTLSSVGYWISFAQGIFRAAELGLEEINGSIQGASSSSAPAPPATPKKPFELSPAEKLPLAYASAALLCGENLNQQTLKAILQYQGIQIIPSYLSLFTLPEVYTLVNGSSPPSENFAAGEVSDPKLDFIDSKKKFKELFDFQGVRVEARTISKHVKIGEVNRLFFMFDVLSGRREQAVEKERIPFSLVIVLDRSGSMSGTKIDQCRKAIISCIERLGPNDLLHLVIYDDTAEVVFQNGSYADREVLIEKVKQVRDRGGTNITAGFECGHTIFMRQKEDSRLKRMFIFSDGVATTRQNEIIPTVEKMKAESIVVSSYGIGADFDEKVMKGIADAGLGNYFFISDYESIPTLVEKGMKGVERIIGTNANIWIRGMQGEEIRKVKGDSSTGFFLGDLREEGIKQMLVEMDWDGKNSAALEGQVISILSYDVTYLLDGREPITITGTIEVIAKLGWETFSEDIDPAIDVQLTIHEVSLLDKLALAELEKNRIGEALRLKKAAKEMLERSKKVDDIGYTSALLVRCEERIKELEQQLSWNRSSQYNRDYAELKKSLHKEIAEEEDCDMGFGLFD